jgi:RNA polymerase sigma-70 factor (ECF subfamily)
MNKTEYKMVVNDGAAAGSGTNDLAGAGSGKSVRAATNRAVEQTVERLYRSHYGKMVANILNRYPDLGLETAEDLVQDSFAVALTEWAQEGIPCNPPGWIYVVIRNRAINRLKADKKMWVVPGAGQVGFDGVGIGFSMGEATRSMEERTLQEQAVDDEQLRLLFACAHPDLSPKVQVVITLKYVVNLKVEAIARTLGMTVDGIDKLLLRARKKIREEKIFLVEPNAAGLVHRLPIVHKIIYLIYNEGYKPALGEAILHEELCGEALILNKALLDNGLGDKATAALHALMLFNAARFGARFGSKGELLDLEDQNREVWSKPLIMMGCDFLRRAGGLDVGGIEGEGRAPGGAGAFKGGGVHGLGRGIPHNGAIRGGAAGAEPGAGADTDGVTTYHYEAAIAWVHCTAKSWLLTEWRLISRLYERLLEWGPNPFVQLSYAIALFYAGERTTALAILHQLLQMPVMNQYYLLNATLGKLYLLEGHPDRSREFFTRALGQTALVSEREFIRRKMELIGD